MKVTIDISDEELDRIILKDLTWHIEDQETVLQRGLNTSKQKKKLKKRINKKVSRYYRV